VERQRLGRTGLERLVVGDPHLVVDQLVGAHLVRQLLAGPYLVGAHVVGAHVERLQLEFHHLAVSDQLTACL